MAELVLLFLVPALFIAAAVWDVASFTIPNLLVLALLVVFAAFIPFAISTGIITWSMTGYHLLAGVIGLVAGVLLFAAGLIGGGDAKLFAVAALWLGLNALFEYALMASIAGGVLTLGLLLIRKAPLPARMMRYGWFVRLTDHKAGIPYGVALSVAALLVLPRTDLFAMAVSG